MKQGINASPMSALARGLFTDRKGLKLATAACALGVMALSSPSAHAYSELIVRGNYDGECRTVDEGAGYFGEIVEGVPLANMMQFWALKFQAEIDEHCKMPDEVWIHANKPLGDDYFGRTVISWGGRLASTGAIFANSGMYVSNLQWMSDANAFDRSDIKGFTIPVVGAPLWSGMVDYTSNLYKSDGHDIAPNAASTMIEMSENKVRNVKEIGFLREGVVSGTVTKNGTVNDFYRTLNITDKSQLVTGKDLEWVSAALYAVDGNTRKKAYDEMELDIDMLSNGLGSPEYASGVAAWPKISGVLSNVSAALLAKPDQFTPKISDMLQSQLQNLRVANPYSCVKSVSTMCDLLQRSNAAVTALSTNLTTLSSQLLSSGGSLALIPAMSNQLSTLGTSVNRVSSVVGAMQIASGGPNGNLTAISSVVARASAALASTIPLTATLSGLVNSIDSQVRSSQAVVGNLTTNFNSVSGAIVTLNTRYLNISSQVAARGSSTGTTVNPLINLQGNGTAPIVDGSANGGLAVGWGANVGSGHTNSVAIGYNSRTSGPNEFSIGSSENLRRLTNVADGTAGTDLVNKGQVDSGFANLGGVNGGGTTTNNAAVVAAAVEKYEKYAAASASMAGALANMPSVDLTRQFGVSAGAAGYGGKTAWSVGASTRIQDHFVFKAGYSRSNGQSMYNAGGNIMW